MSHAKHILSQIEDLRGHSHINPEKLLLWFGIAAQALPNIRCFDIEFDDDSKLHISCDGFLTTLD